jgi:hypothetical protein
MPRMKKPADLRCSQVTAAGAVEFGCNWCGRSSRSGKLYRFRGRDERCWHRGVFCSKSCHDAGQQRSEQIRAEQSTRPATEEPPAD